MSFDQIRTGPVTVEDFRSMEIDWTGHLDHTIPNYWECVLEASATAGLWVDNVLTIILGLFNNGEGIGTVWVISSIHVNTLKIKRLIIQHWYSGLKRLIQCYDLHRLQAIVNPLNTAHVSFIKHFGFAYEGTMQDYSPAGLDADVYGMSLRRAQV